MKVERGASSSIPGRSCGCLLLTLVCCALIAIGVVLFVPNLPALVLRLAGFAPADRIEEEAPGNEGALDGGMEVSEAVSFHSDAFGQIQLPPSSFRAVAISDSGEAKRIHVAFDADALLSLCRGFSNFCESGGHPVRDAVFSFGADSLVVTGEVYIDIFNSWQEMDMALVPAAGDFFRIHSVKLNGIAWEVPDNAFGAQIQALAAGVNQALRGLSLGYTGLRLDLQRLALDASHLVAVFGGE